MENYKLLPDYQLGIDLGYPECCVKQFCIELPYFIDNKCPPNFNVRMFDLRREMARINGKWTGFVPCNVCAQKIKAGETTLQQLIKNRNIIFPPFPHAT